MNDNGAHPNTNGSKPNGERKLTIKQKAFVEFYLQSWNASDAARRAGYKVAGQMGYENLKKPHIAARIQARMDEIQMSADEALMRLSRSARWDPGRYVVIDEDTGHPSVDVQKVIDDDWSFMIKSIKPTAHGTIVEFHDAQAAAKHIDQRDKELRIRMAASVTVATADWMFPDIDELSQEEIDELHEDIFGSDDDNETE